MHELNDWVILLLGLVAAVVTLALWHLLIGV
jgi:hypothetical protein